MPLIYRMLPNVNIPLLVNDLYPLLHAADYEAIRELVTQQPLYLTEPLAFSFGLPVLLMNELMGLNNAPLLELMFELGLAITTELTDEAADFVLSIEALTAEMLVVLLKPHLLSNTSSVRLTATLLRIKAHDRADCLAVLLEHPKVRAALFSHYDVFKTLCVLCEQQIPLTYSLIQHLDEISDDNWFTRLTDHGISLMRLAVNTLLLELVEKLEWRGLNAQDTRRIVTSPTSLFLAIYGKSATIDIVKKLLALGAPTNQLLLYNKQYYSPLSFAVFHKNLAAIHQIQDFKTARNEPMENHFSNRISVQLKRTLLSSLLPFEVAMRNQDDLASLNFWPKQLDEYQFNIDVLELDIGSSIFKDTDSIETKNLILLSVHFIRYKMRGCFKKILALDSFTPALITERLACFFSVCVLSHDITTWMLLMDKLPSDFSLKNSPLADTSLGLLFDRLALEPIKDNRTVLATFVHTLWPHFHNTIQYHWLGLVRDFMIYENTCHDLLLLEQPKKIKGFRKLLNSAAIDGQWEVASDILQQPDLQNQDDDDSLISQFSVTFASQLRHLLSFNTDLDAFKQLITNDLQYESILLCLIYALQFYAEPGAYKIYIDGKEFDIQPLLNLDNDLQTKQSIVNSLINNEAINRNPKRAPYTNYLEIALTQLNPNHQFNAQGNKMAITILSWLDDTAFSADETTDPDADESTELDAVRSFCLVAFLRCAMAQLIALDCLAELKELLEFAHERSWLIKDEFATDLVPDLLSIAFQQGRLNIFEWLLEKTLSQNPLRMTYIVNMPSKSLCINLTFNHQKLNFWKHFELMLATSLNNDSAELYAAKTIHHLVMALKLYTSGKLNQKMQQAAEKSLITLIAKNFSIGYACANYDGKLFHKLFSKMEDRKEWLNHYVENAIKMKENIFLNKILVALIKNGDVQSVLRLLDRAIRKGQMLLFIECCTILHSRIKEGCEGIHKTLRRDSPLVIILQLFMRAKKDKADDMLSYYYRVLKEFLQLDLSHPHSIRAISDCYFRSSPLAYANEVESLLEMPVESFLLMNGMNKEGLIACALANENSTYFVAHPHDIEEIETAVLAEALLKTNNGLFIKTFLTLLHTETIYELFVAGFKKQQDKALEKMAKLLGEQFNQIFPKSFSLLHIACIRRNRGLFDIALAQQESLHDCLELNSENQWCFDQQILKLHTTPVELEKDSAWYQGLTAFEICVLTKQIDFVNKLMHSKPEYNRFYRTREIDARLRGKSLLSVACGFNEPGLVQLMLNGGVDPQFSDYQSAQSIRIQTLLIHAMNQCIKHKRLPFNYLLEAFPEHFNHDTQSELLEQLSNLLKEAEAAQKAQNFIVQTELRIEQLVIQCQNDLSPIDSLKKQLPIYKDFQVLERSANKLKSNLFQQSVQPLLVKVGVLQKDLATLKILIENAKTNTEKISNLRTIYQMFYRALDPIISLRSMTPGFNEYRGTMTTLENSLNMLHYRIEQAKINQVTKVTPPLIQPPAVTASKPIPIKKARRAVAPEDQPANNSPVSSSESSSTSSTSTSSPSSVSPMSLGSEGLLSPIEWTIDDVIRQMVEFLYTERRSDRLVRAVTAIYVPGLGMRYETPPPQPVRQPLPFFNVTGFQISQPDPFEPISDMDSQFS